MANSFVTGTRIADRIAFPIYKGDGGETRIVTMALIGVAIGLLGYAAGLKTAPVQLRTAVVVHEPCSTNTATEYNYL